MKKIKYEDYKKLIDKAAFLYSQKSLFSTKTLISEANIAFMTAKAKYNPEKAKFSTWLSIVISCRFKNLAIHSSCKKYRGIKVSIELAENIPHEQNLEHHCIFKDMVSKLSTNAQNIISIIFYAPRNIIETNLSKNKLTKYLKSKNWSQKKINQGFKEIKEIIQ